MYRAEIAVYRAADLLLAVALLSTALAAMANNSLLATSHITVLQDMVVQSC